MRRNNRQPVSSFPEPFRCWRWEVLRTSEHAWMQRQLSGGRGTVCWYTHVHFNVLSQVQMLTLIIGLGAGKARRWDCRRQA